MVAEVFSINNQAIHQAAAIKGKPRLSHILELYKLQATIGKHEQETDTITILIEYSYLAHLVV